MFDEIMDEFRESSTSRSMKSIVRGLGKAHLQIIVLSSAGMRPGFVPSRQLLEVRGVMELILMIFEKAFEG